MQCLCVCMHVHLCVFWPLCLRFCVSRVNMSISLSVCLRLHLCLRLQLCLCPWLCPNQYLLCVCTSSYSFAHISLCTCLPPLSPPLHTYAYTQWCGYERSKNLQRREVEQQNGRGRGRRRKRHIWSKSGTTHFTERNR